MAVMLHLCPLPTLCLAHHVHHAPHCFQVYYLIACTSGTAWEMSTILWPQQDVNGILCGWRRPSLLLNCIVHAGHVFRDGNHGTERTHRMPLGVDPSYESTYHEAHKGEFEQLRSLVQIPKAWTFMHTDLRWTRQIRLKGRGIDSRTHTLISVAYISWARVQEFVKGEEARTDGPYKFVRRGTP